MKDYIFLEIDDVVKLHDAYIKRYGGLSGIRDKGLLESAMLAPQVTFDNNYLLEDIFLMAATYIHGIIKNHPFVDGNKRTGTFTAVIFLELNDILITFDKDELWQLGVSTATSKMSLEQIAAFFRSKMSN